MKRHVIAASVLAVTITASLGAQTAPAGTVVKPNVNPSVAQTVARPGTLGSSTGSGTSASAGFMAAGPYKLELHAQKKNNQTISASDFDTQTGVSRSGSGITITASDGMALTGTVTGNQFHANGTSGTGGTLALVGASAANGAASGTFTAHDGSTTLTGTFMIYPGLDMGPATTQRKIQNYGDPKPGSDGGGSTCGFWCQLKQWFGL